MSVVTIDGPAGAGKSTVARRLAERLGFRFLDTGAMYRAVTLLALERGLRAEDEAELGRLAAGLELSFDDEGRMRIGARDVSSAIRSAEVTAAVSAISALAPVREAMTAAQRRIAAGGSIVCEGRDMGSVVFPDAELKIYLDAGAEVRAERRAAELEAKGTRVDRAALLEEIRRRDRFDSEREVAPLRRTADQIHVDTTSLERDEVVDELEALARERLGL